MVKIFNRRQEQRRSEDVVTKKYTTCTDDEFKLKERTKSTSVIEMKWSVKKFEHFMTILTSSSERGGCSRGPAGGARGGTIGAIKLLDLKFSRLS